VKELDTESSDDWAKVYNQVMQRSLRFNPLSGRTLERIVEYLSSQGVTFLIGYEGVRPTAVCSYSFDSENKALVVYDFCVLPVNRYVGAKILDQLLSLARTENSKSVQTWLPASSTTTLDVLGEYLFTPGRAKSLMRCFLAEAPKSTDVEIIDISSDNEQSITLLPFEMPFQMQSIMESLTSTWTHSYRIVSEREYSNYVDVYLTNKSRQQAWVFSSRDVDTPISTDLLTGAASFMHDIGVRDILTEVESGDLWQQPYKHLGFERLSTRFEVNIELMH
jgi:hypothetical protein